LAPAFKEKGVNGEILFRLTDVKLFDVFQMVLGEALKFLQDIEKWRGSK
jgi:hypothetical protein